MKKHLLVFTSLLALNSFGQGFSNSAINWGCPDGGKLTGGVQYGLNSSFGTAVSTDNPGSQTWGLMDLNGDNKPDLVVFAQLQAGLVSCFSPGLNAYWKVFLNTGNGFATTPVQWNIPNGGKSANQNIYGFNALSGVASTGDVTGSQTWSLMDMDGDKKPDLVVTAQLQGGKVVGFNPGPGQYWQVFKNNGTGFTAPAINWPLPDGGRRTTSDVYGFDNIAGTANTSEASGSQSWAVMDMNKDNKPDLIVTAQLQAGNVTCFAPGVGQYWKVFLNNGTGFATSPNNWNLPNGGKLSGGITYGYNSIGGTAFTSDNTGSQTWSVMDMDGDRQPDLIVTAQLQAGAVTCFAPGAGPYWKVFTNNGTAFNTTGIDWALPNGGKLSSGTTYGYNNILGYATAFDNAGSQNWNLVDFDNDGRPDLLVTAQLQGGNVTCFSPGGAGQYWKIFANKGNNFSLNSVNWTLPAGGKLTGAISYGFDDVSGVAVTSHNTGSQTWLLNDLDGDYSVDMLVPAQLQGGFVTSFGPGAGQTWKLYKGDGVLGISAIEQSPLKNISVYPNPNNGKFVIRGEKNENLNVSNELGQIILTVELNQENNYTATVSDLIPGIYFVHNKTGGAKMVITE